jgi:serine protease Do
VVLGSLITWSVVAPLGQGQSEPEHGDNDHAAVEQAKGLSRAFRAAAKQVMPTVVKVRTTMTAPRARGGSRGDPFRGFPFDELFGDDLPGFRWRTIPEAPQPGLGSGVIIDPSGIVLTNNHVVTDADEVVVQLGDGREFPVTDVKTDERTDLAVLRIDADESLPAAQLGDSDQMEIGDWVIAIGNPFALEQTVSAGIISGKGRSLDKVKRARFLQTDAAINPGNSGGPLVSLDGKVVGINTAIVGPSYQGIGFAIPSNVAKWVIPQLIERGTVTRAYLGVSVTETTAADAGRLGVRPESGVVVGRVSAGSPAQKAGLRVDDVIATFDGQPIRTSSDLQRIVERSQAGSRHKMAILRKGRPQTIQVRVEAMPDDFEIAMQRAQSGRIGSSEFFQSRQLGLGVIELTDSWADQLGYSDMDGVLIYHVDPDRIAAQAGLRQGMLISRVDDTRIEDVEDFREATEKASLKEGITLEIQTSLGRRRVTLRSS